MKNYFKKLTSVLLVSIFTISNSTLTTFGADSYKLEIPYQFEYARSFSEGLASVMNEDDKVGFIDTKGNLVIDYQFIQNQNYDYYDYDFKEGLSAVMIEPDKYGYIDKTGEIVIPYQFTVAKNFSDGLAVVYNGDNWGYINKTGEIAIPYKFEYAMTFSEGLAVVMDENNKFGYIDKTGELVIPYKFNYAKSFSNGIAVVHDENDSYRYIDKTGNFFKPQRVPSVNKFSEGLSVVSNENSKCGFIDTNGNIVIDYQFYDAYNFSEGLAIVSDENGKHGFISSPYTTTENPIQSKIIFNDKALNIEGELLNIDGRTYYPVRELLESAGGTVKWDQTTKSVKFTLINNTSEFTVDNNKYISNGKTVKMNDAKLILKDDKTYIPIRYAFEGLGYIVNFDDDTKTIVIK